MHKNHNNKIRDKRSKPANCMNVYENKCIKAKQNKVRNKRKLSL